MALNTCKQDSEVLYNPPDSGEFDDIHCEQILHQKFEYEQRTLLKHMKWSILKYHMMKLKNWSTKQNGIKL